jgi:hypothetical protein
VNAIAATFDPAMRGFHAVYRDGETNHCPGCGRTQWYVGRQLAECAFCATALPLESTLGQAPAATITRRGQAACPWSMPGMERPRIIRRKR